jgi:benzoyl-CoA reductase/2-hydroxyglutaryl-CoA dehydratase subunit BcrC/BadD/HgdB
MSMHADLSMGVCAFAEEFLSQSLRWDGPVVFTTLCDQMRRAADQRMTELSPDTTFLLNVPATWQSESAPLLFRSEVERLGKFLVRHGGKEPGAEELSGLMKRYSSGREALFKDRGRLSARQFAEAVMLFDHDGTRLRREQAPRKRGLPIGLIGGPLLPGHLELLDVIEESGGEVAFNGTLSGERGLVPASYGDDWESKPFEALVRSYFAVPDVARRPNTPFYQWMRTRLEETRARGVIVWRYAWCDMWRAESRRISRELNLPVIELDAGGTGQFTVQARNRLDAFLETLIAK